MKISNLLTFTSEEMTPCPKCHRLNPTWLIYCESKDCIAILHSGKAVCAACRSDIPVNARFCPDCGKSTAI